MSWARNAVTYHGKPCVACGRTERYRASNGCVACNRAKSRKQPAATAKPKPKAQPNAVPGISLDRLMAGR